MSCSDAACRTGGVYVNGSIANANVQAASSGTVYLLGLNGTLLLNLADAASIVTHTVGGESPDCCSRHLKPRGLLACSHQVSGMRVVGVLPVLKQCGAATMARAAPVPKGFWLCLSI